LASSVAFGSAFAVSPSAGAAVESLESLGAAVDASALVAGSAAGAGAFGLGGSPLGVADESLAAGSLGAGEAFGPDAFAHARFAHKKPIKRSFGASLRGLRIMRGL
jgi:hypothetical protein